MVKLKKEIHSAYHYYQKNRREQWNWENSIWNCHF